MVTILHPVTGGESYRCGESKVFQQGTTKERRHNPRKPRGINTPLILRRLAIKTARWSAVSAEMTLYLRQASKSFLLLRGSKTSLVVAQAAVTQVVMRKQEKNNQKAIFHYHTIKIVL